MTDEELERLRKMEKTLRENENRVLADAYRRRVLNEERRRQEEKAAEKA